MTAKDDGGGVPSFWAILRHRHYWAIFVGNSMSTWGDFIARLIVAKVIYDRTGSALATAATFTVSLVPSVLGRGLLAPLAARLHYRDVLVSAHLVRAGLVVVLIAAVGLEWSIPALLMLMFVLELAGGPVVVANQMLLTDIFEETRLYAKAFALGALASQVNQAIGLVLGGWLVAVVAPTSGLLFDLASFLVIAAVLLIVVPRLAVDPFALEEGDTALRRVLGGWRRLFRNKLLASLVYLSLVASFAVVAPEALAIPYVGEQGLATAWSGGLMAAPIAGAVLGLVILGRVTAVRQNRAMVAMALAMPLPLLLTPLTPHPVILWFIWFASGILQTFMLPLQSNFTLLVDPPHRGQLYGLAGAIAVAVSGIAFLVAGWLSQLSDPATAVMLCAVASFVGTVLLRAVWPTADLAAAVERTYSWSKLPRSHHGPDDRETGEHA